MPIPNISTLYQRIAKGSEGGNEFARFIKLLLNADCAARGERLSAESDASGDFKKLDAYILHDMRFDIEVLTGFQFKFYPDKLTPQQKHEIVKNIEAARECNIGMREYILVTPEDWQKTEQEWFDRLRKKHEGGFSIRFNGSCIIIDFKLTHWGHSKITELALKHDHLGMYYFPELFPFGAGKFKLASAIIDLDRCNWYQYDDRPKTDYYQNYTHSRKKLTSDPIFDFCFINSTHEIFLLQYIEIHIEDIANRIKGIPAPYLLKSIGAIEYEVDFEKPVNKINFPDPMVFEANKPLRFQLQLKDFTKKCPGNCLHITFWFHFNNHAIPTEKFYLSF
ncbi:MAG: hypothetical protein MUC87_18020 [Bacteroidia bacterium]|jgi:hypothetical protein|nr:hypothetical protein [Bacteroidia bacterium]